MVSIPVIPDTKKYWLVRTQGGKYYDEFRTKGMIAINWDYVTLEDIAGLTDRKLSEKVKTEYPDIVKPGRASSQLKIFANQIKTGDTVVITSYASNNFTIGEVTQDTCFTTEVSQHQINENPKICPYMKRKKVRWIKEVHKWDVEMPMFKLLQHARNTINSADDYADVIESMLHDFYIRGGKAQLSLEVKKEGKILAPVFFSMGTEILDLAAGFNEYSKTFNVDIDQIETKINVNSPGKIKFVGPVKTVLIVGIIVVMITGGGITIPTEQLLGADIDANFNGLLSEVTDYLDHRQAREHKEFLLKQHMQDLEVKSPDELTKLLNAVNVVEETKE